MRPRQIGYWVATAIIAFVVISGGIVDLIRHEDAVESIVRLGYPLYFLTIIGCWKVLGGVVVLAPGLPRLKEWAYAGIFFDMTGAVASHAANGDPWSNLAWPAIFALVALASWALRPPGRTLGVLFPAKTTE
jgi:uncharacterized membrane protein YphA (DoxX/SURF4 family)